MAKAGGRSLDDLNGRIRISDARYRYNDKEIQASNVTVTGENSDAGKFVELRSDFADVTFRSRTSYRTVFEYLRRSARRYLPVLRGGASDEETPGAVAAAPDDFSLLSVDIRNINPVADAVAAGLQIADGTSLRLLFNPASDRLRSRRRPNTSNAAGCWPHASVSMLRTAAIRSRSMPRPRTSTPGCCTCRTSR